MAILSEIEKTGLELRTLCGYMGVTSDDLARQLEVAPVAMLAYYRGLGGPPPVNITTM